MERGNELFPVFLRLDKLHILVVGGGYVGLEKISAIYSNAPDATITLVAPEILPEIEQYASRFPSLKLLRKPFSEEDLENIDLVMAATTIKELNFRVQSAAKSRRILINTADTPELCDFYLSSIVKKGDLKLAISTNGKSPTFAKRLREFFEEVIPQDINNVLDSLHTIREKLKGDFDYKMKQMEEITKKFKEGKQD